MTGLTLDTGALVAFERGSRRALGLVTMARRDRQVVVPAAVVIEWWRGQRGPAARLLESFRVEHLEPRLAKVAGEALARVRKGPSPVDAMVMASAASRGDAVLTSDLDDLDRLRAVFPMVRLLRV